MSTLQTIILVAVGACALNGPRYRFFRPLVGDIVIALLEIYSRAIKPAEDTAVIRNGNAFDEE